MKGPEEARNIIPKDILWLDAPYQTGPILWGDQEADVAIVGGGFTGLAPSQLAGKIIAAMMAGEKSDLTDNVLIGRKPFYVPSAPLMYLGINAYRSLFKLNDWLLGGQG